MDTRKNHQASPDYVAARELSEELLSDGECHPEPELLSASQARGIPGPKMWLAFERLNVRIDGTPGALTYRLPRVRRPTGVTRQAWALEFLKMALAFGEVEWLALYHQADEYDVDYRSLSWAKRQLGVLKRVEHAPTCEGSHMYRIDEYWRLPPVVE